MSDLFKKVNGIRVKITEKEKKNILLEIKNNKPTIEENKELDRKSKKEKRIYDLNNSTVEVNGRVFQTRESDELKFRSKIANLADGDTTRWILANNNVALAVPKEDLIEALSKGYANGQAAFDEYMDGLVAQGRVEP